MVQSFKEWLNRPFDANQSAFRWFLFIGLLICIFAGWRMILAHLEAL